VEIGGGCKAVTSTICETSRARLWPDSGRDTGRCPTGLCSVFLTATPGIQCPEGAELSRVDSCMFIPQSAMNTISIILASTRSGFGSRRRWELRKNLNWIESIPTQLPSLCFHLILSRRRMNRLQLSRKFAPPFRPGRQPPPGRGFLQSGSVQANGEEENQQ